MVSWRTLSINDPSPLSCPLNCFDTTSGTTEWYMNRTEPPYYSISPILIGDVNNDSTLETILSVNESLYALRTNGHVITDRIPYGMYRFDIRRTSIDDEWHDLYPFGLNISSIDDAISISFLIRNYASDEQFNINYSIIIDGKAEYNGKIDRIDANGISKISY